MLTSGPPVTIGMPIRNCAGTVARAIRSILRQTHANWELLIYDDGSTDGTLDVARSFDDPRIRVLSDGTSKRIAVRLNEMIALGGGDYFARLDGDDVAYPERLARQVAYLRDHPGVDLVGCSAICFWGDGEAYGALRHPESHAGICADLAGGFASIHPAWLGRMAWFRRNQYDTRLPVAQDYELLLRSHRTSCFANVPEILLGYCAPPVRLGDYLPRRWRQTESLVADLL
ncbi:MAG: glycosyltransferase family 2 protein, partial [Chloroflexi bacterium]|nr:glycosyltransferase family 2 protein [Chloroflexota bacterium]